METEKWIDKFLYAIDDETEFNFIHDNGKYITNSAFRAILVTYMNAARVAGDDVNEKVRDYVREELADMIAHF